LHKHTHRNVIKGLIESTRTRVGGNYNNIRLMVVLYLKGALGSHTLSKHNSLRWGGRGGNRLGVIKTLCLWWKSWGGRIQAFTTVRKVEIERKVCSGRGMFIYSSISLRHMFTLVIHYWHDMQKDLHVEHVSLTCSTWRSFCISCQ